MFPPRSGNPGGGLKTVGQRVRNLPPEVDQATDTGLSGSSIACPSCGAALELKPAQPAAPPQQGTAPAGLADDGGGGQRY